MQTLLPLRTRGNENNRNQKRISSMSQTMMPKHKTKEPNNQNLYLNRIVLCSISGSQALPKNGWLIRTEKWGFPELQVVSYGSGKKVWWQCSKTECYYSWLATITARSKGSGCPACSGRAVTGRNKLSELCPDLIKEWDFQSNNKTPDEYAYQSNKTVFWICSKAECRHKWSAKIQHRSNGCGCPACNGPYVSEKNKLSLRYPDLIKEWDYELNEKKPEQCAYQSHETVTWICSKTECRYKWPATIKHRSNGRGCPACSGHIVTDKNRLSVLREDLCKEWDFESNKKGPESYTYKSSEPVNWICSIAECRYKWSAIIQNRSNGSGCPACAIRLFGCGTSKIEQKLTYSLKEQFGIDQTIELPIRVYVAKHIVEKANEAHGTGFNCNKIKPDVYIEKEHGLVKPIFIEYDGSRWHKDLVNRDRAKTEILLSAFTDSLVFRIRDKLPSLEYRNTIAEGRYFEIFRDCCGSDKELCLAVQEIYDICLKSGVFSEMDDENV